MPVKLIRKTIHVNGMAGPKCEAEIENALSKLEGVFEAKAIYSNSSVYVAYDSSILKLQRIMEALEQLGYGVITPEGKNQRDIDTGKALSDKGAVSKAIYLINRILSPKKL